MHGFRVRRRVGAGPDTRERATERNVRAEAPYLRIVPVEPLVVRGPSRGRRTRAGWVRATYRLVGANGIVYARRWRRTDARPRLHTLTERIVVSMADPRTIAARLTAQFRSAFADELRSVVVFGSLPRGEAIPGVSDLNILVLLESMTTPTLVRAAPLLQQWMRQGNTPPHIYSWEEWGGMQDTFAIEIADMNDAREVLWGTDPVAVDSVTYANLRLQVEREIRDMLLHLRLRLMVATTDPAEVGGLLLSGCPSFTAYMRAVLRLAGESPGLESRPVIERASALIGADPAPMLTCLEARRTTHHLPVPLSDPLVDRYLAFARALLRYAEQLPADVARPAGAGAAERPSYSPPAPVARAES